MGEITGHSAVPGAAAGQARLVDRLSCQKGDNQPVQLGNGDISSKVWIFSSIKSHFGFLLLYTIAFGLNHELSSNVPAETLIISVTRLLVPKRRLPHLGQK